MSAYISLNHPRFVWAQRAIFTKKVTPDCMSHSCRIIRRRKRSKLDACCRYGVDVDVGERDAILRRKGEIAALLRSDVAAMPWFDDWETEDADYPSGRYVRTETHAGGCVFVAHDQRGCAIHRAALEGDWDFRGVKPHVCRLFPLTYQSDGIVLSDDYPDYSCSRDSTAPSVYRVSRATVGDVFGKELVTALDEAESAVLGVRSRLRIIAAS
ncbi:MAG: hypothetical protein MJE77_38570 [Proteobacteria bacterium]|nr:hypothetical protein [Pseudomonadota bacterium]